MPRLFCEWWIWEVGLLLVCSWFAVGLLLVCCRFRPRMSMALTLDSLSYAHKATLPPVYGDKTASTTGCAQWKYILAMESMLDVISIYAG